VKKFFLFLFSLIITITISACTAEEDVNVLKVSSSSDKLVGGNYQTVISELETIGFTNIKTVVLDDLVTGWLTKNGEVKQVEINGITVFSANTNFPKDAKIVITYHTFPKEEKSDTGSTGQASSGSSVESNQEILTAKNNKDLANLLAVKNEFDPIISEFAKKYAGNTIEFNGNIAHMMSHENYKTRYDFLIYAGDYSKTPAIGPNFKFEDVNVSDLHLTGSKIPENIEVGQNIHIIAKVIKYNEEQELFFLMPISTEIR
jgi:hypothetical protein